MLDLHTVVGGMQPEEACIEASGRQEHFDLSQQEQAVSGNEDLHTAGSTSTAEPCGIISVGYDTDVSYGYPGGSGLQSISVPPPPPAG